jgi:hypothetical protein
MTQADLDAIRSAVDAGRLIIEIWGEPRFARPPHAAADDAPLRVEMRKYKPPGMLAALQSASGVADFTLRTQHALETW